MRLTTIRFPISLGRFLSLLMFVSVLPPAVRAADFSSKVEISTIDIFQYFSQNGRCYKSNAEYEFQTKKLGVRNSNNLKTATNISIILDRDDYTQGQYQLGMKTLFDDNDVLHQVLGSCREIVGNDSATLQKLDCSFEGDGGGFVLSADNNIASVVWKKDAFSLIENINNEENNTVIFNDAEEQKIDFAAQVLSNCEGLTLNRE